MSPNSPKAVGVDIGSNTISCCLLSKKDNSFVLEKDISLPVRLSEALKPGGELLPKAIKRSLEAIKIIKNEFCTDSVLIHAASTAVLRMAKNPQNFILKAQSILGTPIEIIDGETEAYYTCKGAVCGLEPMKEFAVLDVGGQSTELSLTRDKDWEATSMPLGVVSLKERFLDDVPAESQIEELCDYVLGELKKNINKTSVKNLICTGGTPTNLSQLNHRLLEWNREKVHGDIIELETLNHWIEKTITIKTEQRVQKYGMQPMRADIFPTGALVIKTIMSYLEAKRFIVSANGLRVGLAVDLLNNYNRNLKK